MNTDTFINKSIETQLFFLRIMKEHAYFLSISIPSKNKNLIDEAKQFNQIFNELLHKTLSYVTSSTPVRNDAITPYTLAAEKTTAFYTGAPIDTNLTSYEMTLYQEYRHSTPQLLENVAKLNNEALQATKKIIVYKNKIIQDVLGCKLFTTIYPLQLEHIRNEALYYENLLQQIIKQQNENRYDILNKDAFWDIIMAQHSEFIRGSLDPTEETLINQANQFSIAFKDLANKTKDDGSNANTITASSIELTKQIINFKQQGTKGLIDCKIKAIIPPLLSDHVLREANYYLLLLQS